MGNTRAKTASFVCKRKKDANSLPHSVCTCIGIITSVAGSPKGIRAKLKVAELLDVHINSVELFKSQIGATI